MPPIIVGGFLSPWSEQCTIVRNFKRAGIFLIVHREKALVQFEKAAPHQKYTIGLVNIKQVDQIHSGGDIEKQNVLHI